MKKIAAFGAVFFIILSQTFADEHSNDFEKIYFSWQLVGYKMDKQKLDFLNLNPVYFNDYFLNNIFENIEQNNNKNRQTENTNSQETRFGLLDTLFFYTGLIFGGIYSGIYMYNHPQERNIYNSAWEQQKEAEKFYQMIYPNNKSY